jgi:preprotein translocase subunit SecE
MRGTIANSMPQRTMCLVLSATAKLAEATSPAQVAFFKAYAAELKKMSWLDGNDR